MGWTKDQTKRRSRADAFESCKIRVWAFWRAVSLGPLSLAVAANQSTAHRSHTEFQPEQNFAFEWGHRQRTVLPIFSFLFCFETFQPPNRHSFRPSNHLSHSRPYRPQDACHVCLSPPLMLASIEMPVFIPSTPGFRSIYCRLSWSSPAGKALLYLPLSPEWKA